MIGGLVPGTTVIPLLGTLTSYDLNPIGAPSIIALIVGFALAIVARTSSRLPRWMRRAVVALAPYALTALYWRPPMGGSWMHHVEAEEFVAESVYLAFAFGFAIANVRFFSLWQQINGIITSAVILLLIDFWILGWSEPQQSPLGQVFDVTWFCYAAVGICWIAWLLLLAVAYKGGVKEHELLRVSTGCCPCGYDLRGSAGSKTCPECGRPIAADTRFEPIEPSQREP